MKYTKHEKLFLICKEFTMASTFTIIRQQEIWQRGVTVHMRSLIFQLEIENF